MKYDLKKEKIAVHCQTLEEAEKVLDKLKELGANPLHNASYYFHFEGKKLCFRYFSEIFTYDNKENYIYNGFKIITASEYLSQFEEAQKELAKLKVVEVKIIE